MNYIYPPRSLREQREQQHGSSLTQEIIFVAVIILGIIALSAWYQHREDRLVSQGCVQAGYASCSTFSNTPVK